MAKKILTTPIQQSDLAGIKPGDMIYLTGHITTCRDMGHRRVVEEGKTRVNQVIDPLWKPNWMYTDKNKRVQMLVDGLNGSTAKRRL